MARMPDDGDEDYDGIIPNKTGKKKMKWTRFKWVLFVTNLLVRFISLIVT
jgi:hypothetical protein